jgi:tRNA pseudouridine38-40 synthase
MFVRLTLAYVGTRYAGWQRQANAVAVQQLLEEALAALTGESVRVVGAGRTDAGVHAEGQQVSFALARDFPLGGLVHGTNHHLPEDIRVLAAVPAPDGYDAQRDAVAKLYRYRLDRRRVPPPASAPFVVPVPPGLSLAALAAAARATVGRHDFAAFALAGAATRTTVRRIHAAWWEEAGEELVFRIVGEGFLRGMVRSMVGTQLQVATGARPLAGYADLLAGGQRGDAGPTSPAHGLCLERVDDALPPPGAAESLW